MSGDAPLQETDTGWHAVGSLTVSVGATGDDGSVVVVVVVVEVVVVEVVVVELTGALLRPIQTRSPTRKKDSADERFSRYSSRSASLKRTAKPDQESFDFAR